MSQRYEIGAFADRYADPLVLTKTEALIGQKITPGSIDSISKLDKLPYVVIFAGGELTLRRGMTEIYRRGEPHVVVMAGGGTHDVSLSNAQKTGKTMPFDQIRDTRPDQFPPEYLYHPGQAADKNGNVVIFNNQLDDGTYSKITGILNRFTRRFPRKVRTTGARIVSAFVSAALPGNKLRMYSVTPNIGSFEVFKDQNLWGKDITRAEITGNYIQQGLRLAGTLSLLQFNRCPPKIIMKMERDTEFHNRFGGWPIWVDGDTIKSNLRGAVEIKRADMPVYLVGLADKK